MLIILEIMPHIVNQVCEALNNAGLQINIDKTKLLQNLLNFWIYYFGRRY